MLINVSTCKFRRAVRLPEGDVPAQAGSEVKVRAFVDWATPRLKARLNQQVGRPDD